MQADVQYTSQFSSDNNNGLYWKYTSNFANGCAAHLRDGFYRDSNIGFPDGSTFIISNSTFKGAITFESNHHCNVGATGFHCMPTYVFDNCKFEITSGWSGLPMFQFYQNANNYGGLFISSPTSSVSLFPEGYVALVSNVHTWLLSLQNNDCIQTSGMSIGVVGNTNMGGIICKRPLRALKIWTTGLTSSNAPSLTITVEQPIGSSITQFTLNWFQISDPATPDRQGYATPVATGLDLKYIITRSDGADIPSDWVIEFSDPVMGNKWTPDEIRLEIQGRQCPSITTSQHDRRYIMGDERTYLIQTGRGACTSYPDMPSVDCSTVPQLEPDECPELCQDCGSNSFCDCGGTGCVEMTKKSVCDDLSCSSHSVCSGKYLGGDLAPIANACVCSQGWTSPTCDFNPCSGESCSGHGSCETVNDDWRCTCVNGYSGRRCENDCSACFEITHPCGFSNDDSVRYCFLPSGCSYDPVTPPSSGCCYQNCGPECSWKTSCPAASNDCRIGGQCQDNGLCSTETSRPDGSICFSQPSGVCSAGECISSLNNNSSTSPPLSSETTTESLARTTTTSSPLMSTTTTSSSLVSTTTSSVDTTTMWTFLELLQTANTANQNCYIALMDDVTCNEEGSIYRVPLSWIQNVRLPLFHMFHTYTHIYINSIQVDSQQL